jgi:hypothetical protein
MTSTTTTDWNDLEGEEGLDEVRRQMDEAQPAIVPPE